MLTLNVTRTEFEKRILAVIENFNGCPIGKKTKRLSLINQSLKTMLHGTEPSSDSALKYNEHNLDLFFTDTPNIEDETVYMLSENYGYRNCYDDNIRTTYHDSYAIAEQYIYSEIISDHSDEAYSMLHDERVNDVLSWLTDDERKGFDESFSYEVQDITSDSDAATEFAQEINHIGNLKAQRELANLIIESDNIKGTHTIEEAEIPVRKVEVKADKEATMISILAIYLDECGIHNQQYMSITDHKGEVEKMYTDLVLSRMRPVNEVLSSLTNSELDLLCVNGELSGKDEFISLAVSKLPVKTLLSQDFISRIVEANSTLKVEYQCKTEFV